MIVTYFLRGFFWFFVLYDNLLLINSDKFMSVCIEDAVCDKKDLVSKLPKITHVHDKVFKCAMHDHRVVAEMIECYFDAHLTVLLDMASLQFCNTTYIDRDYKQTQSDVLYQVKTFADEHVYIYFLWEHQSTYDKQMPFRLLSYIVRIMQDHLNQGYDDLPIVMPAVVYNGEQSPYPGSCDLLDMFQNRTLASKVMFKPFHLVDLTIEPDDVLLKQAWSALPNMLLKHIRARDFLQVMEKLKNTLAFLYAREGENIADAMLECILRQTNLSDKPRFLEIIQEASREKGERMSSIYEQLIQEGWEQGIEQGIKQGIVRGRVQEREALLNKLKAAGIDAKLLDALNDQ